MSLRHWMLAMVSACAILIIVPVRAVDNQLTCPLKLTNLTGDMFGVQFFHIPESCSSSNHSSCDVNVTTAPHPLNSSFLAVQIEGNAFGWVAVGFSDSETMAESDVVGCVVVDDGSSVSVVDTWNPAGNHTPNVMDSSQDGVCVHKTSFMDGRIVCVFSKYVGVVDPGMDLPLNSPKFVMYGRRVESNIGSTSLLMHSTVPVISMNKINLLNVMEPSTTTAAATTPNVLTTPTTTLPVITSCPNTSLTPGSSIPLTLRSPPMCSRSSCDVYVALSANHNDPNYLDIYMEGSTAGWVAVGFSDSKLMENSDVIYCLVDSDSLVRVVDSWNPSPNHTPTEVDATQEGVCVHSANFSNNRISCLVSRYVLTINEGQDLDFNTSLFIMHGRRNATNHAVSLMQHESAPSVTTNRVNPLLYSSFPRYQFLQLHGIIMLISWPLMGVVGMFFSSWLKPALPNGGWFQIHRALLVMSLFVSAVGIIFAFVANAKQPIPGLVDVNNPTSIAHLTIGLTLFALQITNPIVAIFRCEPDDSKRWMYSIVHVYMIGLTAYLLSMINGCIGLSLFGDLFQSTAPFWIFIAYFSLEMFLEFVLHVVLTITAFRSPPCERKNLLPTTFRDLYSLFKAQEKCRKSTIKLQNFNGDKGTKHEKSFELMRKPPSKDSHIRWVGLGAHLLIALLAVTVAILVAVAPVPSL